MAYCGTPLLKQYLTISGTVDDALLQGCVDRAGSAIDAYCRRRFEGSVMTREYNQFYGRQSTKRLYFDDDCLGIYSLISGDSQVIPTGTAPGFWLLPQNRPPYYALDLKSSYVFSFNTDQSILVSGTWGYSATVMPDVAQAALRLSAYYYHLRSQQGYDVTVNADMGIVTVPEGMPKDVVQLLSPYRRSEYS